MTGIRRRSDVVASGSPWTESGCAPAPVGRESGTRVDRQSADGSETPTQSTTPRRSCPRPASAASGHCGRTRRDSESQRSNLCDASLVVNDKE